MNLIEKLFGVKQNEAASKPEPTVEEKRKAAMALNLCATSISRILASNDMEVLDVEYESILNNLNLQNMVKDEALLSTFKSILDTITFYRLQAGDKKRAAVRYQQRLNGAIWSVGQQGACILMASAANPTPWVAVSAAIMAVGAFCNVRRAKSDATVAYDDEMWKLERSLIEQLHALRYSLFETSWRLSDRYGFEDEWRLTMPQIDQYNKLLEEPDPAWRYFKLSQYRGDFEAYPYYWNELGESAFLAAIVGRERNAALSRDYLQKAESAFDKFLGTDMKLLREDMIGAAARMRLVQIAHERLGKWGDAFKRVPNFTEEIRKLACSAPELLVQAALMLATAFAETQDRAYLKQAIGLLEMVVGQGYDMPTSSRLLSKLYQIVGSECDMAYALLKQHVGEGGVVARDADADKKLLKYDCEVVASRLKEVLERQFNIAQKMSNGGLFNADQETVDMRFQKHLEDLNLRKDSSVKNMLIDIWKDFKKCLNVQFGIVCSRFSFAPEAVGLVAQKIDALITKEIGQYDCNICDWISGKDSRVKQHRAVNRIFEHAKASYVLGIVDAVFSKYDVNDFSDLDVINNGISSLERSVADQMQKNGIAKECESRTVRRDYFSLTTDEQSAQSEMSWEEYQNDVSWGEQKMRGKKWFRIKGKGVGDVISASHRVEEQLERMGYSVRVYTQCSYLAALYPPIAIAWAAHRLATCNPDYEVIRYPQSVEVRYMRDDIHDEEADDGSVKKIVNEFVQETNGSTRFLKEAYQSFLSMFH